MALSRPLTEDRRSLHIAPPVFFGRLLVSCPWLCSSVPSSSTPYFYALPTAKNSACLIFAFLVQFIPLYFCPVSSERTVTLLVESDYSCGA